MTAGVVDALAPWSTGSSLVNFAGPAPAGSVWAPETLERLRRVKATADPRKTFGGGLMPVASSPAGAR